MKLSITLNGAPMNLTADAMTIAQLMAQLDLQGQKVAVECNLEIVPRGDWETHAIQVGDKIEIIDFVGGGV